MMKLGMIIDKSEAGFARAASKGLEYAEICIHPWDFEEDGTCKLSAADFSSYSKKYNVKVGSTGCWGLAPLDKDGKVIERVMKCYKSAMDFAAAVGSPVFHVGCNESAPDWELPDNKNRINCNNAIIMLREVAAYAKEKGLRPSVYNCGWENFIVGPDQWQIILPAVPGLGIKYDTSHCRSRGNDYLVEMRDFGQYINHVHIKGTLYIEPRVLDYPPAGMDNTNWGAVFNMLYINHYDGMISMEPESAFWTGDMADWGLDFSINYIKQFIRK